MKYYTLCVRDGYPARFSPQFGDYDLETVKAERDDYKREHRTFNLKIITTRDARQATINAAIAKLNTL